MINIIPTKLVNINKNYMVHIWGTDELGQQLNGATGIWASLPEEFSLETTANWQPILAGLSQKILGGIFGNVEAAVTTGLAAAGISTQTKYTSHLIWESTSPISLRIPIKLDAVYNANEEVTQIVMRLLSLTLPSETGGTIAGFDTSSITPLKAPGPTMVISSKYKISLSLGRLLVFPSVIVTGVAATFNTRPRSDGNFISADVDLTISTPTIYTKSDLATVFRGLSNPYFGE